MNKLSNNNNETVQNFYDLFRGKTYITKIVKNVICRG